MNKNLVGAILCVMAACLILYSRQQETKAQDTAPAWEYAVLIYGNTDAVIHTGDAEAASELTSLLVPQDSNAANVALALNVMGNEGWELVDLIPGGSTLYMFKRPKD